MLVTRTTAALIFFLIAPLLALVALLIWISDRQSPFYVAERVGRGNVRFRMLKFRTMTSGSAAAGAITAVADTRVTAIGRLLRNAKIDEVPQLVNIILGTMTFFGPRPESPVIVEKYYDDHMLKSLQYLPGLISPGTLWALKNHALIDRASNVEASYAETLLPKRIEMDLAFFEKASSWDRLVLVVETVGLLLGRLVSRRHRE